MARPAGVYSLRVYDYNQNNTSVKFSISRLAIYTLRLNMNAKCQNASLGLCTGHEYVSGFQVPGSMMSSRSVRYRMRYSGSEGHRGSGYYFFPAASAARFSSAAKISQYDQSNGVTGTHLSSACHA